MTGRLCGILLWIEMQRKLLTVRQGVKEISRRDGVESASGRKVKVGKPKSAASKRTVPLNRTAAEGGFCVERPVSKKIRPLCATRAEDMPSRSTSARDIVVC